MTRRYLQNADGTVTRVPSVRLRRSVKRTERGWAGHYIMGSRCAYHRNTLLTCGEQQVIVSTVGNLRSQDAVLRGGMATLAHERYYETMAFHACQAGGYVEIRAERQIDFASPWKITAKKVEDLLDDVDNVADLMHETVVAELMKKLAHGEIPKPKPDAPVGEDE